jgi:hypothetical protein
MYNANRLTTNKVIYPRGEGANMFVTLLSGREEIVENNMHSDSTYLISGRPCIYAELPRTGQS